MPSKRVPPIKGTEAVEPVLRSLQDEGVIEWVSPGRVEHDDVPALVNSVDVVVDQIMSGVYGVAAIESMSASRLVIGRMDPHVIACMPEAPPIVDADPHNLRAVLLDVVSRRDHYAEIAQSGPGYVDRNHSSAVVAERFASAWSGA